MAQGIAGLKRDASRPGRKPPLAPEVIAQVVDKTLHEKPPAATQWSTRTMAQTVGLSQTSVRRTWHAGRPFHAPLLKAKPSEYLACGRVIVSFEPEEKRVCYVPEYFPAENILFASDYPHWDSQFPNAVATLADRDDLPGGSHAQDLLRQPAAVLCHQSRPRTVRHSALMEVRVTPPSGSQAGQLRA